MSVVTVKRPPRAHPPAVPGEELRLESPPELPRGAGGQWWQSLLPMLATGGSAAFFFLPGSQMIMKVMGGLMVASTVAMAVAQLNSSRKGGGEDLEDERRDYLKYLAQLRREVRRTAALQRDAQLYLHPAPDQLWSVVAEGSRLWERRPGDADFGQARIGTGPQRLATPLVAPRTAPREELEPLTAAAMKSFLAVHGSLPELPLAVSLRAFHHLTVSGDPESVYGTVRAALAQLATLHSPDDLVVGVAAAPGAAPEWEWVKWLPHVQHPTEADGAGSLRLICHSLDELERLLAEELAGRPRFSRDAPPVLDRKHLVVVLDRAPVGPDSLLAGGLAGADGLHGVTVVEVVPGELDEPRGGLSVLVEPERMRLVAGRGAVYRGRPDTLSGRQAEALARQLAPLRASVGDSDEPLLANLDFTELMGVGDAAAVDVSRTWRPRAAHERLRVPIGLGAGGEPVVLDLKESALEGMGPHGLCVGATGSGKSELLRTLVLGLAMTHSSETLNFVLADFKGGATFAGMADLPHTSAVITNMAEELTLVDRMRDAVTGELNRRQELLRAAGNYPNVHDYERARAAGAPLEPLPSLLLIIDEFSELLTAKPDFIDMFIQIGRIGRSLGVHLLLASQRLEEGRLRGLETYLSYRIGLRTFSAAESRAALGVPDAYHLPSVPGVGYLKFGTDVMAQFKAAYVSGPHRSGGPRRAPGRARRQQPVLFTGAPVALPLLPSHELEPPRPPRRDDALADTVLDVIVARLAGQGPPAHQVWLPPLNQAPALDQLLPPLTTTADRGLAPADYPAAGRLAVPIGLVDRPFEQRRDLMYLDFSGAAGHGIVVGGPRSGKSTLLRAMIGAFALTHTPAEVQFYCLDFGGGGMLQVEGLPQVGGVAGRLDAEKVRRMVAEVSGLVTRREAVFRAQGIDSIATFRARRRQGLLPEERYGDVFLVVDGWLTFRQEFELLEPVVTDLAQRGLAYGVHLVVGASRYGELRPALKDLMQTRVELKLGDAMESEIDRKAAVNVPAGVPGRGLTAEKLHFLGALPRIDGSTSVEDLADGLAALVTAVGGGWGGPRAPQVRLLPELLPAEQLPKAAEHPRLGIAIGVDESALAPVFVDFRTDPHFVVFGDGEAGKTALLRLLLQGITEQYTPEQARIVIGDYRRALLGQVATPHLLEYAAAQPALQAFLTDIRGSMERRIPGPDVTQEQLRDRSWWSGAELFLVIDDYDLVATASGNPLTQLLEVLPFAKDVGLHLIIARRSGGAGRALYEPVLQRLRELGTQGIVMSGEKDEGVLLGNVRPQRMPPGRGVLVTRRRGSFTVQTGWLPVR
ncbi:type VII secretion protein EccCa [Streptacidiphilus sp. P02-A3a]|uniref:type VII secretion protein EccCa n=1 Tax=Streptacidiphilus sp. P02-A3a TaxID=2704468 RepID=UPI0015F84591|nr:type VII secretion protein EccCa [Streptacidiphilus sp. P02-A3a]QMU72274.1 type VII secretion protein EccCa [Streptacidiphilus sp. P02-A3a]